MEEKVLEEFNRIITLLEESGVKDKKIQVMHPLIENVAWMKMKLEDSRQAIKNSQVVIPYNNGGGQQGIRENPLYKGYEALWKSYMQGMSKIIDSIPEDKKEIKQEELERPRTMLEIVRARKDA